MQRPEITTSNLIEWDQSQRSVIDFCYKERLLVDAGPGTGKTAVACGRVSRLIGSKAVRPNRILMISFTRTAVREIRNRIASQLRNSYTAYAVKIGTLDSHAWEIRSRLDEGAKIEGSHEDNIKNALDLIRLDQDQKVSSHLQNIEHLIIDEAQDFIGTRANLVIEFILKLSPKCGVTIFSDEAQAIYGFTDAQRTRDKDRFAQQLFSDKIRRGDAGEFHECKLTYVHRTGSPKLQEIFLNIRGKVLAITSESDNSKLTEIREDIKKHAHGKVEIHQNGQQIPMPPDQDDALVLYRTRGSVLLRSSLLMEEGIPHRVRMAGLPTCLVPWIGAALAEYTESILSKKRFKELWEDRIHDSPFAVYERDSSWEQLVSIAGCTETSVDMHKLQKRLGDQKPPPELCDAEMGQSGFIVGTIHASKGREADIVHLMLPEIRSNDRNWDEEVRVVFVGATRGRSQLLVGEENSPMFGKVEKSGRTYHHIKDGTKTGMCAQVEIGHDRDITVGGLTGVTFFKNCSDVRASQERIRSFADRRASLIAELNREMNYSYLLKENRHDKFIAVLSRNMKSDFFCIRDAISNKRRFPGYSLHLPQKISYLHVRGVRTIAIPANMAADKRQNLHEPWRSSGIMLAPLVLGYSKMYFEYRYKGQKL